MCQGIEHTALVRQNITRRPTRTGRVVIPRIGWDLPTNGVERFDSCDEVVELLIQGASTFFSSCNCNGRVGARRDRNRIHVGNSVANDEFVEATLDVWEIPAESARRVGHPAPFPVKLPLRLSDLYTYHSYL